MLKHDDVTVAELTAEELTFLLQPLKRNSSLTRIEFYSFGVGGDNEGNFVFQDLLDAIATKTSLLALQVTSRVNKMNSLDDTCKPYVSFKSVLNHEFTRRVQRENQSRERCVVVEAPADVVERRDEFESELQSPDEPELLDRHRRRTRELGSTDVAELQLQFDC